MRLWNRFPRKMEVELPLLPNSEGEIQERSRKGGWDKMIIKAPFDPNHSAVPRLTETTAQMPHLLKTQDTFSTWKSSLTSLKSAAKAHATGGRTGTKAAKGQRPLKWVLVRRSEVHKGSQG